MIVLKHRESGLMKECVTGFSWTTFFFGLCVTGFSWTTFFFGLFVPLVRGDLKWAAIVFVLGMIIGIPTFGIGTFGVHTVFAFVYNKIYIRGLMERGFVPADETSRNWCIANGLLGAGG